MVNLVSCAPSICGHCMRNVFSLPLCWRLCVTRARWLKQGQFKEAQGVLKDLQPTQPDEFILRAVVSAAIGQDSGNAEQLKDAQQNFQIFGASQTHCDTIPGRQCMAQCFFLLKQFEDVNVYLKSIGPYLQQSDAFNYNYGISQAACGQWAGAEVAFDAVRSDELRAEFSYIAWKAKTKIHCDKPQLAWEAYLSLEASSKSYTLLQMIANECYLLGHFFYALKAFDVLERLDPSPEFWEGKRGACIGAFQMILAGKEPQDNIGEIVNMLRNTSNPQVEYIMRVIRRWAKVRTKLHVVLCVTVVSKHSLSLTVHSAFVCDIVDLHLKGIFASFCIYTMLDSRTMVRTGQWSCPRLGGGWAWTRGGQRQRNGRRIFTPAPIEGEGVSPLHLYCTQFDERAETARSLEVV